MSEAEEDYESDVETRQSCLVARKPERGMFVVSDRSVMCVSTYGVQRGLQHDPLNQQKSGFKPGVVQVLDKDTFYR